MLRCCIGNVVQPTEWLWCLPRIQSELNHSKPSTGSTPYAVIYGFTPDFIIDYTADPDIDLPAARVDAADALDFAAMNMKYYYDRHHTAMFLAPGDYALLCLHKGYDLPSELNSKLSQQYAGPFKVLEKVGHLAYRLQLLDHWQIHDVFMIAQLETAPPPGSDPFTRTAYDELGLVEPNTDIYEVSQILDKWIIRKGRGFSTQYRIQWNGWAPEYNRWYRKQDLEGCDVLKH